MKVAKLDSDWISYTSQNLFREMVIHSHYGIFSFKLKIFIRFCMKLNHFSSFEKNNFILIFQVLLILSLELRVIVQKICHSLLLDSKTLDVQIASKSYVLITTSPCPVWSRISALRAFIIHRLIERRPPDMCVYLWKNGLSAHRKKLFSWILIFYRLEVNEKLLALVRNTHCYPGFWMVRFLVMWSKYLLVCNKNLSY